VTTTRAPLTPADAAKVWKDLESQIEAFKPVASRFEAAAKVLKKHMDENDLAEYRGIVRTVGSGGMRLDEAAVKAHLGERLADFMRDTVRVSLSRKTRRR
jgi:hypothetical protein